ncbi:gmp synthase protein [Rutstroemia sp. NJR-2017a WRK4]|nr:gmp synthase protein [Rutstroemia sp. NJR-2017a WRK4]
MSGFKDTLKGGWHPKGKDGKSKESWKGDFKGINQVAGWMGKGKSPSEEAQEHVSQPISSLKDPASFGPPPKNVKYHGGAAMPNQITPDTSGWGAPIPASEIRAQQEAEEAEARRREEEAKKPPPPPVPYRADRTGLSTAHLPPPPGRKDGADGRTPPLVPSPAATKSKPPGLPPRLPPRQNSNPSPSAPSPPPTYGAATSEADPSRGILNQGALSRLGAAGISVPGFNVGGKSKPAPPPPARDSTTASPSPPPPASRSNSAQVNELQSRFSRLTSSSSSPSPSAPTEGTTLAQKQAALKTASAFRNDPSSVSLRDAQSAASTANNFRERHGEQVKSGWASANKLNTKYGIADKVSAYGGAREASPARSVETAEGNGTIALAKKKPAPPPPPPKKRGTEIGGGPSADAGTPPPIPLATKPKPADLPLDLPSLWFLQSPIPFPPPSIARLPGTRTATYSTSWSSNGVRKTHTLTGIIRDNTTLSSTKLKLTWDSSSPAHSIRALQKHIPPPPPLSQTQLQTLSTTYSPRVASWAEDHLGMQVGNGECWTLAFEALKAVAAECEKRGEEPCMVSQSYVHGYQIYESKNGVAEPRGGVQEAGVVRGDVLQFFESHFRDKQGGQKWAGAPDHTSVVVGAQDDVVQKLTFLLVEPNGVVKVVEQNVGGVKTVMKGEYNMAELVKGEVRIFRAVGESWAGKLDPTWD